MGGGKKKIQQGKYSYHWIFTNVVYFANIPS